ncbi:hypothetical protein SpCBS45565_g00853 [Spizellomyces sp. 'palustris']|nr:hypothetical protein SpCBS45565_g00853 [Spizellomyces sp. 'palustris']
MTSTNRPMYQPLPLHTDPFFINRKRSFHASQEHELARPIPQKRSSVQHLLSQSDPNINIRAVQKGVGDDAPRSPLETLAAVATSLLSLAEGKPRDLPEPIARQVPVAVPNKTATSPGVGAANAAEIGLHGHLPTTEPHNHRIPNGSHRYPEPRPFHQHDRETPFYPQNARPIVDGRIPHPISAGLAPPLLTPPVAPPAPQPIHVTPNRNADTHCIHTPPSNYSPRPDQGRNCQYKSPDVIDLTHGDDVNAYHHARRNTATYPPSAPRPVTSMPSQSLHWSSGRNPATSSRAPGKPLQPTGVSRTGEVGPQVSTRLAAYEASLHRYDTLYSRVKGDMHLRRQAPNVLISYMILEKDAVKKKHVLNGHIHPPTLVRVSQPTYYRQPPPPEQPYPSPYQGPPYHDASAEWQHRKPDPRTLPPTAHFQPRPQPPPRPSNYPTYAPYTPTSTYSIHAQPSTRYPPAIQQPYQFSSSTYQRPLPDHPQPKRLKPSYDGYPPAPHHPPGPNGRYYPARGVCDWRA